MPSDGDILSHLQSRAWSESPPREEDGDESGEEDALRGNDPDPDPDSDAGSANAAKRGGSATKVPARVEVKGRRGLGEELMGVYADKGELVNGSPLYVKEQEDDAHGLAHLLYHAAAQHGESQSRKWHLTDGREHMTEVRSGSGRGKGGGGLSPSRRLQP